MPPKSYPFNLRFPLINIKTLGSWFPVSNFLHLTNTKYLSLSNYHFNSDPPQNR
ncbi:hypothetical protein HanRHA438_Chr14g0635011 [Helianthus annuus]|uniref:Uncharacterized protein n=1 Tax=Helianthus annuus TaxID=4232 RepID=A0A251SJ65_HELAN|nr:hypothetical protein HanXRQr2_Chr14g0625021 [Helianthus annuus]KAJ0838869.1 hypothetical protein HanPSC8_Chr14g0599801 [Helianthus annuus]KAJ0852164.1 hypothetical protein HanRHA438_Chr14g0635011 [Helianthus annuus]